MNILAMPTEWEEYTYHKLRGKQIARRWWRENKAKFVGVPEYPATAAQADPQ